MRPKLRLTAAEAVALVARGPDLDIRALLAAAPRGDGHTVLALPGFGRGDGHTRQVRAALSRIGYDAQAWKLGVDFGPTRRLIDGAAERLKTLAGQHGRVSLVGFSMGGLFARLLAHRYPQRVRQVVSVFSPIQDPAHNFWLPLAPFLGLWPGPDLRALADEIARPLPVPCTSVYSRGDGLVHWAACIDPACPDDCFEVAGRHVLAARNDAVMRIVAERLARPLDERAGHEVN
jgi:pimeloyl-ACP methyl ester carboxylesterase